MGLGFSVYGVPLRPLGMEGRLGVRVGVYDSTLCHGLYSNAEVPVPLSFETVQSGTPDSEPQEYGRNIIEHEVGLFLLCSYYILRVPCLGFPVKSLYPW